MKKNADTATQGGPDSPQGEIIPGNGEPFRSCPRFANCSAPKCPLDPLEDDRDEIGGDEVCRAHKPTRLKIASQFGGILPRRGYTRAEWKRKVRRESRTPEQIERDRAKVARMNAARKDMTGTQVEAVG